MYGNYINPYVNQKSYYPYYPNNINDNQNKINPIQPIQTSAPFGLLGKTVDSIDVVKAMDIPLDGSTSYFPLSDGSAILTKKLQSDGTSKIIIYKPIEEKKEKEQTYVTYQELDERLELIDIEDINDIKDLKDELKNLQKEIKEVKSQLKDKVVKKWITTR